MGIFGAKRVHWDDTSLSWRAAHAEVLVTSSADMEDDDGIAGPRAYGARFTLGYVPGSEMTLWAYPCPGGPGTDPGIIIIGWRVHYRAGTWQTALYHSDVACGEWYDRLPAAEADCISIIRQLMESGAACAPLPASYIHWGGQPW